MFTKILVAVSANSPDSVLASAIELAQKYDARVFALHVVDPTPGYAGPADYNFGLIVEAMEAHGREIVTRVTNVLDDHARSAETRMVTLPMSGFTIGYAIAAFAEESGADLILLGQRKSGWWRWLNEDVATDVRRRTGTPIQIVSGKIADGSSRRTENLWADVPATGAR
ncbi:universal stress protein [Paraburkholderia phenazinium]|jgi:nucleotide-binding universal stress UspA family protein|uniref:Nucleotide-binding universal stress protein, UspA family n=1 Tax=Paraburkholderia phenazinium TaxID=60549 RepID=A0A1G7SKT1_9BURK|nr:universal stress protein [Paraburkholderia phenazinium]SDG23502.1 Nucleotide-binding universal stress protein, UspA family [Paraburkholderia phenazinium]